MLLVITTTGNVSKTAIQDLITDFLLPYVDATLENSDTDNAVIQRLRLAGIPVYDLARGLYPLPDMPPAASESHAEPLSPTPVYDVVEAGGKRLRIDLSGLGLTTLQMEEINKIVEEVMQGISVREELHPVRYENGIRVTVPDEVLAEEHAAYSEELLMTPPQPRQAETYAQFLKDEEVKELLGIDPIEDTTGKIKCWKSKRGIIRVARKSKPRPGETEVWLTQREIDEL